MKFGTDIHGAPLMSPSDFVDLLLLALDEKSSINSR